MDRQQILAALTEVMDPELNRSLVDLQMVQDIAIDGDIVTVTIALTTKGCPLKDKIVQSVKERLAKVPGVGGVHVRLSQMSPEQKERLMGIGRSCAPFAAKEAETQIIAVASGKGGVGKSTVTVNLAIALRQLGWRVGVLDCDIYGFSVPRLLGVEGEHPAVCDGKMVPIAAHGLKIMSMGFFVEENTPVIWRGPLLGKVLRQFLEDVDWGDLDFLLLDLPPGTGDMALNVAQAMPDAKLLVVTTPQELAAGVASRAAQMARTTGQQIIGVVENMAGFICPHCQQKTSIFGAGGGARLAQELDVPLLSELPLISQVSVNNEAQLPALVKDSSIAKDYADLATKVVAALNK